ncbi:MAG: CRISPR-associated endonuclease Cas1 [Deltaproteobacteria bacterium]|nr:CRISPR-associated endonuclease Cas1 [Deltaproteobacteria bacterium]
MDRMYVLEPGSTLRKSGRNLRLMKNDVLLGEIPLENLEQLTLLGFASLSGAVLDTLIRHRVETVLLSPTGSFRARLMVDEHKHVQRRQAQYLRLSDNATALRVARAVVQGKVRNAARFLSQRGAASGNGELLRAGAQLKGIADFVEKQEDMETVRGLEGLAGNLYFSVFRHLILVPGFSFTGRNRRPPLDPVNALLSFVYTLLTLEVLTAVKWVGLDPYLGALHVVDYGRPSLACDLVEEWRTFLGDRFILGLINRRAVGPEDFIVRTVTCTDGVDEEDLKGKRPVEMKPAVARAFIQSYEKWMANGIRCPETGDRTDYRGLIRRQVRRFNRYLLGELESYEPFLWSRVK